MTAASYSNPHLHIVTLERGDDGELRLDDERCASLIFEHRASLETRELQQKVAGFCSTFQIEELKLRAGASRGQYVASPLSYKVEAILELVPGVEVDPISSSAIGVWVRKQPVLPAPQNVGHDAAWRAGQSRAIEAAAYALFDEAPPPKAIQ